VRGDVPVYGGPGGAVLSFKCHVLVVVVVVIAVVTVAFFGGLFFAAAVVCRFD